MGSLTVAGADILRALPVVLAAGLLAGCSGVKTYPNTLEKNLQVRSETIAGSALFGVKAGLGVHRVDERCQLQFEGVVELDRPSVAVGIPTERWSYLVFNFDNSSMLGGPSSINRETLFRPRAGYRYDIAVTYKKDIYHVAIREIPAKGGAGREIEFRNIRQCRPPWRATVS